MIKRFVKKIKNAIKYRHFLSSLVFKQFKVRYAQSYLSMTWLVLEPLLLVLTLSYIFTAIGRKAPGGHPFPIFFYSGLLPWNYFVNSLVQGTTSFISDSSLIKKIYYPRELSVVKTIAVNFIDFLFANVAFIVILIIYNYSVNWNFFYIPVLLILQTTFVYGLALIFASMNVFVRDIGIIVNTLRTLWFWATPIIFYYPYAGKTKFLYYVNPMTGIIVNYRIIIMDGNPPVIKYLYSVLVASFILIILSSIVFKRLEREFVDVL